MKTGEEIDEVYSINEMSFLSDASTAHFSAHLNTHLIVHLTAHPIAHPFTQLAAHLIALHTKNKQNECS